MSSAWPVPDFLYPFSLRVFLGQVCPGHPGTLTRSFSLFTLAVAILLFNWSLIKVGYGVTLRRYSQAISNILQDLLQDFVSCFSINFW